MNYISVSLPMDTILELENISSYQEADHEPPAAGTRPVSTTGTAGQREALAPTLTQAAAAENPTTPAGNRVPSGASSASSSSQHTQAVESPTTCENVNTERQSTLSQDTERPCTGGNRAETRLSVQRVQPPQTPAQPTGQDGAQRRQSLASHTSRDITGQREPIRQSIIEESPPLYDHLFPNGGSGAPTTETQHCACLPRDSRQHGSLPPAVRHSQSMSCDHSGHHCSNNCYPYSSHHHLPAGIPLPGGIGNHSEHDHTSRYHSTVLPIHHHGNQRNTEDGVDDYIKLSFVCVILCSLHLNLPALLCVLPALAYSIMAQKYTMEGHQRKARKYSRAALSCNLLAFCQYIILILTAGVVVAFVVVGVKISL